MTLVKRTLLIAMLIAIGSIQASAKQFDFDSGLITTLVDELGVTEEQAEGGTGALFRYAKDKLDDEKYGKITEALPQVTSWIKKAPEADSLSGMLGNALGGSSKELGYMAALTPVFKKLGLNEEMIAKYLPIVMAYVKTKGGDALKGYLGKVFD